MKAVIFTSKGIEDLEFWYPYYRLREAEFDIDVVSSEYDIIGKYGTQLPNGYLTSNYSNKNCCDLIIIPGGWQAPEILRQDQNVLQFLQQHNVKGTLIGAICHGPQVLISAQICNDRTMTCYKGIKDDLINAGANYKNEPVIIDQNFVTSPHYKNNPDFMKAILRKLNV